MLGSSADMSAMLDFAFSPAGAHTAQLPASPYFPEILLYNSKEIIYLFKNLDKIHPGAVGEIDPRSVCTVLELNHHSLWVDGKHIRRNARVPKTAVVVNNPAARFDLVDSSEWSHLLSFCLR